MMVHQIGGTITVARNQRLDDLAVFVNPAIHRMRAAIFRCRLKCGIQKSIKSMGQFGSGKDLGFKRL